MQAPIRTRDAVQARKYVIERFGLDEHAPFVEAAKELIERDRLLCEADVSSRRGACAFLTCYWRRKTFAEAIGGRGVRPLPKVTA